MAVLCNYGNRNLGDEASLAAIVQEIRERCIGVSVYGISFDPEDTEARHGVVALPAIAGRRPTRLQPNPISAAPARRKKPRAIERVKTTLQTVPVVRQVINLAGGVWRVARGVAAEAPFVVSSLRRLRGLDLLVVGGGGQLADEFGGLWGQPYVILKWSLMARCMGARVVFISVGAGPLGSRAARFFVKRALRLADYCSFRDQASKELIAGLGVSGDVYPDVAYAVHVKRVARTSRPDPRPQTVGLNPFPYHEGHYWQGGDPVRYGTYLDTLTQFTAWLVSRGYSVVLFSTQLRADPRVIKDLRERLAHQAPRAARLVQEATAETLTDLLETIAGLDIVVTGRFHGILLSFLMLKPVVALSYQHKIDELMRQAGHADYVLPMSTVDLPALVTRFEAAQDRRIDIACRLAKSLRSQRRALTEQFDALFGTRGQAPAHYSSQPTP